MSPYPLMYHDVTPAGRENISGFPGRPAARYKVTPGTFGAHLHAIRDALDAPPWLTFDDGGASAMLVADMLEAFGWRGWFFVTAGFLNHPGFLTSAHVAELAGRGHRIGSHSWSHPPAMARLSDRELRHQWGASVDELAAIIGAPIRTASVPGGAFGSRVADAAGEAGIRLLFTSRPTAAVATHGLVAVAGRYAIRRTTPARRAAVAARGTAWPRLAQCAWWDLKATAKRTLGAAFAAVRDRAVVEPLSS